MPWHMHQTISHNILGTSKALWQQLRNWFITQVAILYISLDFMFKFFSLIGNAKRKILLIPNDHCLEHPSTECLAKHNILHSPVAISSSSNWHSSQVDTFQMPKCWDYCRWFHKTAELHQESFEISYNNLVTSSNRLSAQELADITKVAVGK